MRETMASDGKREGGILRLAYDQHPEEGMGWKGWRKWSAATAKLLTPWTSGGDCGGHGLG